MKSLFLAALACGMAASLRAETTPLTEPLLEEKEMLIACALATPPPRHSVPVFLSGRDEKAAVGTYHYKLWLPQGYLAAPEKRWPCLFIAMPGGYARMGAMGEYLKSHGFVVVMLVEAKHGPWPPIVGNFLAAHDDVSQRVRLAEGRKYATGHSGGARASSVYVQVRPGFRGLVLQSAGAAHDENGAYAVTAIRMDSRLSTVMTIGKADRNYAEVAPMKKAMPAGQFEVLEFEGGHAPATAALFTQAMEWIEKKNGSVNQEPKP